MNKNRLEAFSDGVLAVAITLLVLDLHVDHSSPLSLAEQFRDEWPTFAAYVVSFFYIGVIWLNHHQAFTAIKQVNKGVHLANIALLFTTALIPFPTAVLSRAFIDGADTPDARTAVARSAARYVSWVSGDHDDET